MTKPSYIESENFIERSDINEFLRDHRVIRELYNILLKQHADTHILGEKLGLHIFNHAYRICNIASTPKGTVDEVLRVGRTKLGEQRIVSVRCVAWALLRLHEGLVYVSPEIVTFLQDECRRSGFYSCYQNFLRNYAGSFDTPINFSGIVIAPKEKPLEKSLDEKFQDAKMSFLARAEQILERNKELEHMLKVQEEKHVRELEERQSTVNMLSNKLSQSRKQNEQLRADLETMTEKASTPRTVIKEVVRKEVIATPESKVFCAQSWAEYAKSLPKDEDAAFIVTAMTDICMRNRFFDDDVLNTIESIKTEREKARLEMEKKQREAIELTRGNTFNIGRVGQLNPSAVEVNNTYERKSLGAKLSDLFEDLDIEVKPSTRVAGTIDLSALDQPAPRTRRKKD